MSPSPELSPQSSKSSSADQDFLDTSAVSPSKVPSDDAPSESAETGKTAESSSSTPLLRKPPVRPIAKPQPPAQPVESKPPAASGVTPATPPARGLVSNPVENGQSASTASTTVVEASLRQQPIPPPSEPKQYRAIGLVRGQYTPSEEEFTRGDMVTTDGTSLKSVLLGRVMSLVKNHVDLGKNHLWVVYPRIRELEARELNLQIVGIWEPETLKRPDEESEEGSDTSTVEFVDSESLDDGYFSIRGEIVFYSEEENHIVVKIQQAPRKSSQKAKAFKISLKGALENPKTVGYFWDFDVRLEQDNLVMVNSTCVGMAPPRKRSPEELAAGKGRPRRSSMGGRRPAGAGGGGGRPPSPRPGAPRTGGTRESTPKPVKRTAEPSSDA
jgi:hypothetical protein